MKNTIIIMLLSLTLFASPWCPITGLKISENLATSYSAKLEANDAQRVYSSIYALLVDMKDYGVYDIKKYDIKTKTYIDAEDSSIEEAQKSIKAKFKLMRVVYKKRAYPMGKKLYKKRCPQDIDVNDFLEISDLKKELQEKCDLKQESYLHSTAVYLWDVKREGGVISKESRVKVNEDEKCPVCGMFTYKYPRWAAQIFYKHGDHEHRYSFDGVKDLMKFYFDPMRWGDYTTSKIENITKILVTDYYSQKAIDGRNAFYVIRSDIYGPMGHELIPFEDEDDAKTFKADHKGKIIIRFKDIIEEEVYKLDSSE